MWASIGVIVMGRHLFDLVNGWEGDPPTGDHVVVVSHRPKPDGWHPEASYHFVDDVTAAIAKAQDLGRRAAPSPSTPAMSAARSLLPGSWTRSPWTSCRSSSARASATSAAFEDQHLLDDPHIVIQGERVLHLRFKVRRAA